MQYHRLRHPETHLPVVQTPTDPPPEEVTVSDQQPETVRPFKVRTAADLAAHEALVALPTRGDTPLHDSLAAAFGITLRFSNVA